MALDDHVIKIFLDVSLFNMQQSSGAAEHIPTVELSSVTPNTTPARVQQSSAVLQSSAAWQVILDRIRLVETDDTEPIQDRDKLANLYTTWMHEWLRENLTQKQQSFDNKQKSSIFAAFLKKNYGGKAFVMALWQTGIQWLSLIHI